MIVGVGCIAHDHVLITESTGDPGKGRIAHREVRFGGNVRNALAAAAGLGQQAAYLASVGTSLVSEQAIEDLGVHGIDTSFVDRREGADPVTATLIITADGERYIAFDDATLATTPLPSGATIERAIGAADVLLVDASTAPPGTLDVVESARSQGVPVVLDAERDLNDEMTALVAAADHLIIPLTFGAIITGHSAPQEIAAALWNDRRRALVLTDGTAGSYAAERPDDIFHVSSFDVDPIDTTGCGDAFHGAYAVALSQGLDLRDRVTFASAAAAVVAAREPGRRRTPTLTEVAHLTG